MPNRTISAITDAVALVLLPCVLAACALMDLKASAALTLLAAVAAVAVFAAGWERSRPALRQLLPPSVLAAAAVVGRVAMAAVPNVQPVTAICVISGVTFGKRSGFMTGALAALASSLFMGFGAWTPWQAYSWGLAGYVAGMLFREGVAEPSRVRTALVCAYGFAASFLFGALMNAWMLVGFVRTVTWQTVLAVYGSGFAFDLAHAASTVAFLLLLYVPWSRKLRRIAIKYRL